MNKSKKQHLNKPYEKETYSKSRKSKYDKEYVVGKQTTLLEFLLENVKHQSRNNIKSLLSHKKVLVDGVVISQFDYLLHAKQIVRLSSVPIKADKLQTNLKVIYEDEYLIAINKPAGLLSVATDKEDRKTAYRMVADYARLKDKHNHIYVVHRIDKETSGVLLFSKTNKIREELQDDWNNNVKLRGYIAIVEGKMKPEYGTIKTYLKETSTHVMYSTPNKKLGQEAITHYRTIKSNGNYSMLEVNIDTGRKNQIRVHMSESGHPIIGDDKYGEKPADPIKRLGLHANCLEFIHPITKKLIKLKAPIPISFNKLF